MGLARQARYFNRTEHDRQWSWMEEPSACRSVYDGVMTWAPHVLLPFVLGASIGPLPVDTVTLKGGAGACSYLIRYLRTGVARIDDELATDARRLATICDPLLSRSKRSVTSVKPQVVRNDARIFSVWVNESKESREEHYQQRVGFTFLRPDGRQVALAEIFELTGLHEISRLAVAALEKRLSVYDRVRIAEGAGPLWRNFAHFVLGPETLMLYFEKGIVGTLSDGPQEISLPLAVLAPYFRRDWRAPAPSFDCRQAMTSVERAICSDVDLARSERFSIRPSE